jgi:hypothetical protein
MDRETDAVDGDLPDDDPAVVRGMERLRELRKLENQITDLHQRDPAPGL